MRFLLRWQHVAPGTRLRGRAACAEIVAQLQGFELAAGAWEASCLPARIAGYRRWLDELCLVGRGRLGPLAPAPQRGRPARAKGAPPARARR